MTGLNDEQLKSLEDYVRNLGVLLDAFWEIRSLNDEFESDRIEYLRGRVELHKGLYHSGALQSQNIRFSAYIRTIEDFLNLSVPVPGET